MKIKHDSEMFLVKFKFDEARKARPISPECQTKTGEMLTTAELQKELSRRKLNEKNAHIRKTTCTIKRATSATESIELGCFEVTNHADYMFVKSEGRKESFKRLTDRLMKEGKITKAERTTLLNEFMKLCPKSLRNLAVKR